MFAAEVLAPTPVLRDINLGLNVSEANKNAVLRKFHRFIYSASYLKRVRKNTCPLCGLALSGNENHCQICGEKIHRSFYDHLSCMAHHHRRIMGDYDIAQNVKMPS